MDSLAAHPDIGLPNRQYDCDDNELLNPIRIQETRRHYEAVAGRSLSKEGDLIDAFFASNQSFAYAGFKSMPLRHSDLRCLVEDPDVQIITIRRWDLCSTAASFLLAMRFGTWRREGEKQENFYEFLGEDQQPVRDNLAYLEKSWRLLKGLPSAIDLIFEDFCYEGHSDPLLEQYFERPIAFLNPRPPRSGAEYIKNWGEFREFVAKNWIELGGPRELLNAPG